MTTQEKIRQALAKRDTITANSLSNRLRVSIETIKRNVREMEKDGIVYVERVTRRKYGVSGRRSKGRAGQYTEWHISLMGQ